MKCLALSYKGTEDITALEIKELIKAETKIIEAAVLFEAESLEEAAKLCYKAQSIRRILILLDNFKIESIEDLKKVSKIDFSKWLKGKTFAVRAELIQNSDYSTQEIEGETAENVQTDSKVNLKNPDIVIFNHIYKENCYIGIDFSGDLSKRDYKIFTNWNDLKGTLAYALVRLSGYEPGKALLNPFCANGTIAIEAALFGSGKSPNFFNKQKFPFLKFLEIDLAKFDQEEKETNVSAVDSELRFIKSAEKNSKIAGIKLNAEKIYLIDLPEKFKDIDCIISNLPRKTRDYELLLEQAKIVLKKGGKLVISSCDVIDLQEAAKKQGFIEVEKRNIFYGSEVLKIATFRF